MAYYSFKSDDGEVIIESDDGVRGTVPVSSSSSVIETDKNINDIIDRINQIIPNLRKSLKKNLDDADEVKVDFGFKVSGKVGLVIVSSNVDANFNVSILWKKPGDKS